MSDVKKIRSIDEFRDYIKVVRDLNSTNEDLLAFLDDCDDLLDWCEEVNYFLKTNLTEVLDDAQSSLDTARSFIPDEWE